MTNQEKMQKERELLTKNLSFNLIGRRLGRLDEVHEPIQTIEGVAEISKQLNYHGGYFQQNRMIKDKQQSLRKALLYSYQGAFVKKYYPNSEDYAPDKVRALINPNKLTQDYNDKTISIEFEHGYKVGDIYEWVDTNTYWLIYLQDETEIAYFRGDARKCTYQIFWKDGDKEKSTYAAIKGPNQSNINSTSAHGLSLDQPNYQISLIVPQTEDTLKQFKRYSKFYLQNIKGSEQICWRVEATDSISSPGILEITAVEYYANQFEDDVENGIVGGLVAEIADPNDELVEQMIQGETFIKPKIKYKYVFNGSDQGEWQFDKKNLPIRIERKYKNEIEIVWDKTYSGQFVLSFGDYSKTIIVESLF